MYRTFFKNFLYLFTVFTILTAVACDLPATPQIMPAPPKDDLIRIEAAKFSDLCQTLSTDIQNADAAISSLRGFNWPEIADMYLCNNPYGVGRRIYLTDYLPSSKQTNDILESSSLCSTLAAKLWTERPYLMPQTTVEIATKLTQNQWQMVNDQLLLELMRLFSGIVGLKNDANEQFSAVRAFIALKNMRYNSDSFSADITRYNTLIDKALAYLNMANQQALELGNWNFSSLELPTLKKTLPVPSTPQQNASLKVIGQNEEVYFLCNQSYSDSEPHFRWPWWRQPWP